MPKAKTPETNAAKSGAVVISLVAVLVAAVLGNFDVLDNCAVKGTSWPVAWLGDT